MLYLILEVIGLYGFRCCRHVALPSLTPLSHVFMHCLGSFLMQDMSQEFAFEGQNMKFYHEYMYVAYLHYIL